MSGRYGRYQLALGGLIAAALLLGVVGEGHSQSRDADQQIQAPGSPQAPVAALPYASVYQPPCDKAPTSKDAQDCEQARSVGATISQARWAFWQLIIGAVGVAAVVVTLIFTSRATIAAERAAEAAQKSIGHQSETDRRQLRAYVFLESATLLDGTTEIPPHPARDNKPSCFLLVKNSGQTPAYHVVHWAEIRLLERKYEHTIAVPSVIERINACSVGANGVVNRFVNYDGTLTPHDIANIFAGTHAIYVYGRIEYTDAFGYRHSTNYRLNYSNGVYPAPINVALNFCNAGNETDDDPKPVGST